MYCIIFPRALGKMIQLTTHFEWFVSSTNVTLCLYFFLPSCSQYLTVYCTPKSNKIYPVIKAGKKYFKKVDHLATVSPIYSGYDMNTQTLRPLRTGSLITIRGAFGKFLAWSIISVTDLQTLSCLVSF